MILVPRDTGIGISLRFEDEMPKVLSLHLNLHPRRVLDSTTAIAPVARHLPRTIT